MPVCVSAAAGPPGGSTGARMKFWILAAAGVVIVAAAAARARHPFRALTLSALCGAALLAALQALQPYTGFALSLNRVTGYVCAVLGAPGVIGLLFLTLLLG